MHTFWFLFMLVGGFCGIASGIDNVRKYRDGTIWFMLGALNFVIAGVELSKIS